MISKYPILKKQSIQGNAAFLLDVGESKMIVIVVHFPCCDNDEDRQLEVDRIMQFVRQVKSGISPFGTLPNTPIIIMGDTNFVG